MARRNEGILYFDLRRLEAKAKNSITIDNRDEIGRLAASLILLRFDPVVFDKETRGFLGADSIHVIDLSGPTEILSDKDKKYSDGRFVRPILHDELDAVVMSTDLTRDGSPYVPDDLESQIIESPRLSIVVPRPLPRHAVSWTHPFVMVEDTIIADGTPTPIRNYLRANGVTRSGYRAEESLESFPGLIGQEDIACLVGLTEVLKVSTIGTTVDN